VANREYPSHQRRDLEGGFPFAEKNEFSLEIAGLVASYPTHSFIMMWLTT